MNHLPHRPHSPAACLGALCLLLAAGPSGAQAFTVPFEPPAPDTAPTGAGGPRRPASGFLGIGVCAVDTARARELGLREALGVEVTRVEDDSPAARAGVQPGDVVRAFNGTTLDAVEQFVRLAQASTPGRPVSLQLLRRGTARTLAVTPVSRLARVTNKPLDTAVLIPLHTATLVAGLEPPLDVPRPLLAWRNASLGLEVEPLAAQLARYFGVREGVLVRSVAPGSPSDQAGLRAGDVIIQVGDTPVATPQEIGTALRTTRPSPSVPLGIMRDRQETTLTLLLDPAPSSPSSAIEEHPARPRSFRVRAPR